MPRQHVENTKEFWSENEAKRAKKHANKRIIYWPPFWNKVYGRRFVTHPLHYRELTTRNNEPVKLTGLSSNGPLNTEIETALVSQTNQTMEFTDTVGPRLNGPRLSGLNSFSATSFSWKLVIFNDPLQIFFLQIMWWNPGTNWVSFASNTKFHNARGDCTRLLKFRGNLRFNIFISQNFNQFFVNFLLDLWMFCQVIQTPCHHWNKNKKMSNIQPSGSLNSQIPKHFGVRKMLLALVDD